MPGIGTSLARSLAWLAWGLTVGSAAVALAIRVASGAPIPENRFQLGDAGFLAFGALTLAFATTGLLISLRRPRHPIGWLLFVVGGLYGLSAAAGAYTFHVMATMDPVTPHVLWAAWATLLTAELGGAALFVLIWVFPDGRPPVRAPWSVVILAAGIVLQLAGSFADPNLFFPAFPAPVTLPGGLGSAMADVVERPLMMVAAAVGGVVTIGVLIVRARRSRGTERQQLKWFAFGGLLATASLLVLMVTGQLTPEADEVGELPLVVFLLSTTAIPIAVAIAILRYRLYDIDRILGRTLVYGALTALLAAAYGATVVVLSAAFAPLTGGDSLAVAAATLGVAGLFQPIRRRLQVIVDRRFFRARYDAVQTVASFASALRDQVDLERLTYELRLVVDGTMQPASSSVWVRGTHDRPPGREPLAEVPT